MGTEPGIILEHFRGREDYIAVQHGESGFRPVRVESWLSKEEYEKYHLTGEKCFGFYLLRPDNTVMCTCVDVDNHNDANPNWRGDTQDIYNALVDVGLSPLVEISSSGSGSHVWLVFDQPVPAWVTRSFWRAMWTHMDANHPEIYPRQDKLTGKGLGNLIRLPFWNRSHFVDIGADWEPVPLSSVPLCSESELKFIGRNLGTPLEPEVSLEERVTGKLSPQVSTLLKRKECLLYRRWHGEFEGMEDKSHSALAMSISCELVRLRVPTYDIESALRIWCDENDYEKGTRMGWVEHTVNKAYSMVNRRQSLQTKTHTLGEAAVGFIKKYSSGEEIYFGTGVKVLDDSFEGVAPGEMAVVGARPGHGKTAFAMQWIDNVAMGGTPSLIISAEMSAYELGRRAILYNTEYDAEEIKDNPGPVISEVERIYADKAPIYVEDQAYGIDEICTLIENHCSVNGTRFVAVDYIQLLGSTKPGRYEQVTEISQRLKQVAKRCQCAIVALCQMSRESERRERWNPQLADLKESGQIEQDADIVIFLCWVHKVEKNRKKEEYPIRIAKRRNGPVQEEWVVATFNPEKQAFGEYKKQSAQGAKQPSSSKQDSESPDSVEGASLF